MRNKGHTLIRWQVRRVDEGLVFAWFIAVAIGVSIAISKAEFEDPEFNITLKKLEYNKNFICALYL